jgi:hypothetical protein
VFKDISTSASASTTTSAIMEEEDAGTCTGSDIAKARELSKM